MKKIFSLVIIIILIVLLSFFVKDNSYIVFNKIEQIYKDITSNFKQYLVDNEYKKSVNYEYVQINKSTKIKNKEDLKNAIYTYLDSGWDKYVVKCDFSYLNCTKDIKELAEDKSFLTNISNFVHPFNTFDRLNTSISASGKITFQKTERYTKEQIEIINKKIDEIYNENYDKSKNAKENIKIFHDYIINNTKYDSDNKLTTTSPSSSAYGVLINKLGVCSGYSDVMSIFLNKMNIKNYRISSNSHIWNLVFVEGEWLHLDLTWDDPVNSDGSDTLSDEFFLINTNNLFEKDTTEHNFDTNVYIEAK